MVPTRFDDAPEAVHDGIESAAGRVIEDVEIAVGGIKNPCAADARVALVFLKRGIEMSCTVKRFVGGENDPAIGGIARIDVVEIGGLVLDEANGRRRVGVEDDRVKIRNFVKLPKEGSRISRVGWGAQDNAEDGLLAVPMDRRIAHANPNTILGTAGAETGFASEIHQAKIGGHEPEITPASGVGSVG